VLHGATGGVDVDVDSQAGYRPRKKSRKIVQENVGLSDSACAVA
jgi:hypothetical protein